MQEVTQYACLDTFSDLCFFITLQGAESYRDPNIAAHHLHGHYGNPGTNNDPCDPPPPPGVTCYRGDNIYADILPGQCTEYQYDVAGVMTPGTFW
jgi:hypothetical protein